MRNIVSVCELLEIVTCYKYLGLLFCNNGNYNARCN